MKVTTFDKNIPIKNSIPYIGYMMLKQFTKSENGKISFYKLVKVLKKIDPRCNSKQFMFALIFLYSLGMIEFNKPYIEINYNEAN
ncbi:MAG: ABC-three component system middle component 6 [Microgenomates group bacterium]